MTLNENTLAKEKITLLEYTILSLAIWQCKEKSTTIDEFLEDNNFSEHKIALLPFFISTANGINTRTLLFNFYNNFHAEEIGYIEQDVKNNLKNSSIEYTKTELTSFKFRFLENPELTLEDYKNSFQLEYPLVNSPNHPDFTTYYSLIDHSIEVYNKNKWLIFDYSEDALIRLCRRHSGWQAYRKLALHDTTIDIDILIEEKSVYSAEPENRILI